MRYFAHVSENGDMQTVKRHLLGVAEKAALFADSFGAAIHARQVGMAHDIGKYTGPYQIRLLNEGAKVDHSTAGAAELILRRDVLGALCVAGHHGGLPDLGTPADTADSSTLQGRVKRKHQGKLADYSYFKEEIELAQLSPKDCMPLPEDDAGFANSYYYTKFLFSCLVDADFLDTEKFMNREDRTYHYHTIQELFKKLNTHIQKWGNPTSELNKLRCDILERCIVCGGEDKGLYSLTTPTGGGKTTASLAFALKHACTHSMQRIIYVIPYTSIIEQNVAVFRDILGDENVLAHYSEAVYDDDDGKTKKKLAAENWDAPVIVTTSVQFFESLFSCKTSKNRKLHNIANSVVIFDEFQMIPLKHMLLCTDAIYRLVKYFNCTALLCTATQPGTEHFFHEMKCKEIVANSTELFQKLKRVTYAHAGELSVEDLSNRLSLCDQVLCVVNTRKTAKKIYAQMEGEDTFHLSTYMVPKHRRKTLEIIRQRLREGRPCRVISTSLIEAGVDVDFPEVYREENGLDSIVQAGGRCNRAGTRSADESNVWVFRLDQPFPRLQRINRDAMRETIASGCEIDSPEAVRKYFQTLFDLAGDNVMGEADILKMIKEGASSGKLPFRTISEKFHMIDQNTRTVYVPFDDYGGKLTKRLADGEHSRQLFRELGKYGVDLYPNAYRELEATGVIMEYDEDAAVLSNLNYYSESTGLEIPECEEGNGFFI